MNKVVSRLIINKCVLSSPSFSLAKKAIFHSLSMNKCSFSSISSNLLVSRSFSRFNFGLCNFVRFLNTPIVLSQYSSPIDINSKNFSENKKMAQSEVSFDDCIFSYCYSGQNNDGGALDLFKCFISIKNSVFHKCSSQNCGGAISNRRSVAMTIESSVFQCNKAEFASGSLHLFLVFVTEVTSTNFSENTAKVRAGCISALSCESIGYFNSYFINSSSKGYGTVRIDYGSHSFEECRVCSTNTKSAIWGTDICSAMIMSSFFAKNEGSSIYWSSSGEISITESSFARPQNEEIVLSSNNEKSLRIGGGVTFSSKVDGISVSYFPIADSSMVISSVTPKSVTPSPSPKQIIIVLDDEKKKREVEKDKVIIIQMPSRKPASSYYLPSPTGPRIIGTSTLFGTVGVFSLVVLFIVYRICKANKPPEPNTSVFNRLEDPQARKQSKNKQADIDNFFDD